MHGLDPLDIGGGGDPAVPAAVTSIGSGPAPGTGVGPPPRSSTAVAVALAAAGLLASGLFLLLGWWVRRDVSPLGVDGRVGRWFDRMPLSGSNPLVTAVGQLGAPVPAALLLVALFWWVDRGGDRRLTKLVALGPPAAMVLAQVVAKPVIGRQLGGSFTFPSTHSAAAWSLATVAVLSCWADGRAGRRATLLCSLLAVPAAVAVSVAVIIAGWHPVTDSAGGMLLGLGVSLLAGAVCLHAVPADRPLFARPATRRTVAVVAAGAIGLSGAVRLPYLILSPGSLIPLNSALTVDPAVLDGSGPLNGTYSGLTVRSTRLTLAGWAWHEVRDSPDPIVLRETIIPKGESGREYRAEQQQVFADASEVAVAVAERALGQPVTVTGDGALITAISPDGPAAGLLAVGDVLTSVGGRAVTTDADLRNALAAAAGDAGADPAAPDAPESIDVEVGVRGPDGSTRTETVGLEVLEQTGRYGLGVGVTTSNLDFVLPTSVSVDGGSVGGPSAGLLTALAVYDALSEEDVAAGRHVTGTGTLDVDGAVGQIGGIEEKVRAAVAAGADLFFAPADQAEDARAAADGRIDVVPVHTFDEALSALRAA